LIAELGNFSLSLSLCMAILLAIMPLVGAQTQITRWMHLARPLAYAQLLFIGFSYICLTYGFIQHDFSIAYVAHNSNTALPFVYLISGVWGAHEGSLLLWILILAGWTAAVARFSRDIPLKMLSRILAVMGMISVGFILFTLFTSNPFARLFPIPLEGRDLNPLLQDPGLIIHPPMLYMGYVGFSVAFAFAIAALISGKADAAWARWSRPWTNIAWMFLTIGIVLGSWWAYYELGWGGWWFWDPVENASFMPWLVGTALIHSLAATEKRGTLKAWTLLLAIAAFSLSLLGTFLVRSGVLTSVHAFATDPTRGVFILIFLVITIGGSLTLYAFRASQIRSAAQFGFVSRESGLLINNVLLFVAALSVLLGTLYPLFIDALGLGKISVGPPYFNSVFIPLMLPLLLLCGVAVYLRWKSDKLSRLINVVVALIVISIITALLVSYIYFTDLKWQALLGIAVGCWAIFGTLSEWGRRWIKRKNKLNAITKIPAAINGMTVAHVGLGVCAIGIALVSLYSVEKDVRLAAGQSENIGPYVFTFNGINEIQGPNYTAVRGSVDVSQKNEVKATLTPEKRFYPIQASPMTEAAIDPGLTRDLYVALGDQLDETNWSLRLYYKPFVRWIWLGGLLMGLGGLIAVCDKRYRSQSNLAKATSNNKKSTEAEMTQATV